MGDGTHKPSPFLPHIEIKVSILILCFTVIGFVLHIFHDITNRTMQYAAEDLYCVGADTFISF